jgi:hypothetical protein
MNDRFQDDELVKFLRGNPGSRLGHNQYLTSI